MWHWPGICPDANGCQDYSVTQLLQWTVVPASQGQVCRGLGDICWAPPQWWPPPTFLYITRDRLRNSTMLNFQPAPAVNAWKYCPDQDSRIGQYRALPPPYTHTPHTSCLHLCSKVMLIRFFSSSSSSKSFSSWFVSNKLMWTLQSWFDSKKTIVKHLLLYLQFIKPKLLLSRVVCKYPCQHFWSGSLEKQNSLS